MNAAPLCTEGQFMQRAPQRLFNDCNNLQFSDLTTNQVVGYTESVPHTSSGCPKTHEQILDSYEVQVDSFFGIMWINRLKNMNFNSDS